LSKIETLTSTEKISRVKELLDFCVTQQILLDNKNWPTKIAQLYHLRTDRWTDGQTDRQTHDDS